MALVQRIESLQKRHSTIQSHLEFEESRPFPDAALIQQLKKEKLQLKDEITRLSGEEQKAA